MLPPIMWEALQALGTFIVGTLGAGTVLTLMFRKGLDIIADSHGKRLQHELEVATHLAQSRNSALIERRTNAIADLHSELVNVHVLLLNMLAVKDILRTRGHNDPDVLDDFNTAHTAIGLLLRSIGRGRISLDLETCEVLDALAKDLKGSVLRAFEFGFDKDPEPLGDVMSKLTAAAKRVENQFRKLLGA